MKDRITFEDYSNDIISLCESIYGSDITVFTSIHRNKHKHAAMIVTSYMCGILIGLDQSISLTGETINELKEKIRRSEYNNEPEILI